MFSQIHSNSISIFILYIRIMIIFFIRYSSKPCIIKCLRSIPIFISLRILILFILPFFWHHYSLVPKIVTYSLRIIINNIRIMIIFLSRYNTFLTHYHSFSITIIISIFPFFWNLYILRLQYLLNCFTNIIC